MLYYNVHHFSYHDKWNIALTMRISLGFYRLLTPRELMDQKPVPMLNGKNAKSSQIDMKILIIIFNSANMST